MLNNNPLTNNVKKYLNKFALHNWTNTNSIDKKFQAIVVIPIIAEFENLHSLLQSLAENDSFYLDKTLILFVINNLKSSPKEIKIDNSKSMKFLKEIISNNNFKNLNIDFIDASSDGFELDEKDGGVGLARKIGMDFSLNLFDYQHKNKNIIICLDGDCMVENNYISTIFEYFNHNKVSAAYVNFKHLNSIDTENEKAIINYEIFLRYYILGLTFANSPYAYHSIGSTMICDVDSYIKVQGMNKKKAAEDFYFMEKLSKITPIKKISGTAVLPSSRGSWRVPFGTGQRVNRFIHKTQNEYVLYAPDSFEILKQWISIFFDKQNLTSSKYLTKAKSIDICLHKFLTDNNFGNSWDKIVANSSSDEQVQKQKRLWFDGFRTLKLIHYLRDKKLPQINMFDAIDEMFSKMNISFPHKNNKNQIPELEIQKEYLEKLREIA